MKSLKESLILAAALMCGPAAMAQETVLKFAIGEWAPYTGKDIPSNGMAAEIVTAACNAAGLKAQFDFLPWKRAENEVANAAYFGTFPYKQIKEREVNHLFTDALFSSSFGILMKRENPKLTSFAYTKPEDFKPFTVGIIVGTDAAKLPLLKVGAKVEEVNDPGQNLQKLTAGRIDFYIDDRAVIFQELKKSPEQMANFKFSDSDFGDKADSKIMISRQYPNAKALIDQFNGGLQKIKSSGELKKILTKYGF